MLLQKCQLIRNRLLECVSQINIEMADGVADDFALRGLPGVAQRGACRCHAVLLTDGKQNGALNLFGVVTGEMTADGESYTSGHLILVLASLRH